MIRAVALLWLLANAARADCAGCHATRPEERLRAPVSLVDPAHAACESCHGGDPDEATMRAHDPSHGFRGRAQGLEGVLLCGRCHEEIARDVRSGSHQGEGAPSCATCHRAHGVSAAPDPVETCAECHDAREWRSSVHGVLRTGGEARAPACASCHDPHRAEAGLPAAASCASCHERIRAAFDHGPHAARFRELGFLDCVECHRSHAIRAADATLLRGVTAACARCHAEGTEVFASVRALGDQAPGVERARALPRDDPRRIAVIEALHALDVRGLSRAVDRVPRPRAVRARPAPPESRGLAWAIGGALVGLALLFVLSRARRR